MTPDWLAVALDEAAERGPERWWWGRPRRASAFADASAYADAFAYADASAYADAYAMTRREWPGPTPHAEMGAAHGDTP